MKKRTKRIISVIELIIIIPVLVWFFCPRTFSWACGENYDRADITAVTVMMSGANEALDTAQSFSLTPGSAECDKLLDLLESRHYVPMYGEEGWDAAVGYAIDIHIDTEKGPCSVSLSADSPIHFTDDHGDRIHDTFRVTGATFQQEVLELVMELNGTPITE